MEGLGFAKTTHRTFHDTPYILTISGDNESLGIEVEHADNGRRWRSKFAARFIEEITQRTGNAKKFDIFVRMLLSALAQESDAVYLDVLTARDLEMLRRHANPQGPPATSVAGQSDKRYLILTYRAEFDKVHYPLPLPLDERSEEETLRSVVARLKTELSEAQQTIAHMGEGSLPSVARNDDRVAKLQRQCSEMNDALQTARRESEQLRSELRTRAPGGDAVEANKLKGELTRVKAELKLLKEDGRQREVALKRELEFAARELKTSQQKVERLQAQIRKQEEEDRRVAGPRRPVSRPHSADRSRPASRSPSAERSRPPSARLAPRPGGSRPTSASRPAQPESRPASRASSVASSRERTPSPSSFLGRGRTGPPPADVLRGDARPWQRSDSPGAARRHDRNMASPTATLSPYRQPLSLAPSGRRTASPAQQRDRTPSPGSRAASAASVAPPRQMLSLRERTTPSPLDAGIGGMKPTASRYSGRQPEEPLQPGSLFGLAANLGLGPGALSSGGSMGGYGIAGKGAAAGDGACDIDARLQALQSFLKQTKNVPG